MQAILESLSKGGYQVSRAIEVALVPELCLHPNRVRMIGNEGKLYPFPVAQIRLDDVDSCL